MSQFLAVLIAVSLLSMLSFTTAEAAYHTLPQGITMGTGESSYTKEETVVITGQVNPIRANNLFVMKVLAPDNQQYRYDEFEVNTADGSFMWSFVLGRDIQAGQWTIEAKYSTYRAETTFMVIDGNLFDKVIAGGPVLANGQGQEINSGEARPDQSISVTANLANDESVEQPFVFIVQIISMEDETVRLVSWTSGSLPANQSLNPVVGWLPKEEGTYIAEIFVWSSLKDPTPLAEKQTLTFQIQD